jgi:hypothetical protein
MFMDSTKGKSVDAILFRTVRVADMNRSARVSGMKLIFLPPTTIVEGSPKGAVISCNHQRVGIVSESKYATICPDA